MTDLSAAHFVVEYTVPPSDERRWTINCSVDVLCSTAERALEMVREKSPDCTVHVIRRVGSNKVILLDKGLVSSTPDPPLAVGS